MHRDPARGRPYERFGDDPPCRIVREDVGLQMDLVPGRIEGRRKRREVRTAALQQFDRMPCEETGVGVCRLHRASAFSRG